MALPLIAIYCNWKYEVIAFHPFRSDDQHELKVMTWNVHCPNGADSLRQRSIAELILKEDADFVQLNEFHQDSCSVMDSILRTRYLYTEECQSHQRCGDIFYSKLKIYNSGRVKMPRRDVIRPIKATIAVSVDSVHIFGVHMVSNYNDGKLGKQVGNGTLSFERYKIAQGLRCIQAHWIKNAVIESKHPVIVMGDMNDFNCSAPLDTLTSCGLRDAWWEGGNGYGCTFHDGWLRLRIDHILHSKGLNLESIKVINSDLSDHNPVVAGFSIEH